MATTEINVTGILSSTTDSMEGGKKDAWISILLINSRVEMELKEIY